MKCGHISEWVSVCVCACMHACLLLNTQLYKFLCILFFSARTRIWMCDFPKCCLILVCGARAAGVSSSESLTNAEMLFFAFVKWIEQQQRCGLMDVWERAALFDVRVAPIFELFYLNLNVILKLIGLARRDDWNITTQSLWTNLKREKNTDENDENALPTYENWGSNWVRERVGEMKVVWRIFY